MVVLVLTPYLRVGVSHYSCTENHQGYVLFLVLTDLLVSHICATSVTCTHICTSKSQDPSVDLLTCFKYHDFHVSSSNDLQILSVFVIQMEQ